MVLTARLSGIQTARHHPSRSLLHDNGPRIHPPRRQARSDLKRWVGAVLLSVGLAEYASAQSSVTLAWDPSTGSEVAGYRLYEGGASKAYTNTIDTGNVTTQSVSGLTAGGTYFFAVTAYDTNGLESDFSNEISYSVPAPSNAPPVIALASPVSGASYTAPATVSLIAAVTPNGHMISGVQFYNGSTLLGSAVGAPYSFSWINVSAGTYSLSAQVAYDSGSLVSCTPVNVTVANLLLPSIALISPTNGASFTEPASITLAASVTPNGHTISKVQFYKGATLLAENTAAPYTFVWNNVAGGTYSLSARATYDSSSTVVSAALGVTVKKRPRVNIHKGSPTTKSLTFQQPAEVILSVTDGDPGTVCELQSSPDLKNWTAVDAWTLDSIGCFQLTNSVPTEIESRFFRVQAK
jgi:hypothetical protein